MFYVLHKTHPITNNCIQLPLVHKLYLKSGKKYYLYPYNKIFLRTNQLM